MRSVRDKKGVSEDGRGYSSFLLRRIISLVVISCTLFSIQISAQDLKVLPRPDPPRLVNDLAGMLAPEEVRALEQKLVSYGDSTSTQIAIVTIPSIEGNDIAQYATELHHQWGIGQKGKDNGILILVAKTEHKVFISTGRGVEADLPDIICKRIIDHTITPQFKSERYYQGINAGTDEIITRLSGQFVNDKPEADNQEGISSSRAKVIAFFIVIFIIIIFSFINRGGGGQTLGGGGGLWFLLGALSGMGGGRDSGGGFGGDGGGGGGFGGFGGGDSGGGGAGGSW